MKKMFLSLMLIPLICDAQNESQQEILVFFNRGIQQASVIENGKQVKRPFFTDGKLQRFLYDIGLNDTMIHVAMPKFNRADTLRTLSDGSKITSADMSKLYRIKVPKSKDLNEILDKLRKLPEVLYADPNGGVAPHVIPSDTRFNQQWGLRNTLVPGADIHATDAWNIYTGNLSSIIGIIDGGADDTHQDLNAKIAGGDAGFGWEGHGVHVAGIAAAESNNSQGVCGVNWNARIHDQRIDNVSDDIDTYQAIIDAVNYSTNLQVLNHSYGLVTQPGNVPGRYSTTVREAFAYAYKANRTNVASAGNDQLTFPGVIGYPAGFESVITVGATDNNDQIATFSMEGNHIDVCAPGVSIMSTLTGNTYGSMTGTSMAAPHVTGIASLIKGLKPEASNDDIENIIELSADDRGPAGFDNEYGFGRVNAHRTLQYSRSPYSLNQWSTIGGTVHSSTSTYSAVFLGVPGLGSGVYVVKRYEIRKNVTFPKTFHTFLGAWGRGYGTKGWRLINPNFGEGFCEIVPGTLTSTSATLRTYIYEVWNMAGQYYGFYPKSAANVEFQYSVLGISPYITGDFSVCSAGKTYTLNDAPTGVPITWSYSPNMQLVSSSGNTITLRSVQNGEGWIKATVGTYSTPNFVVWSGLFNTGATGPTAVCPNSIYTYTAVVPGGHKASYSYAWTYPSNWYNNGQYNNNIYLQTPYSPQYGTVRVAITNECGTSSYSGLTVYPQYNCGSYYMVYPNPTSDILNVEINPESLLNKVNDSDNVTAKKGYTVRIINNAGYMVKTLNVTGLVFEISVSDLENGAYIIELFDGKNAYRNQFFVNR